MQSHKLDQSTLSWVLYHFKRRQKFIVLLALSLACLSVVWLSHDLPLRKLRNSSQPPSTEQQTPSLLYDSSLHQSSLIPLKIWQILLPKKTAKKKEIDAKTLEDTTTWLAINTDCTYSLVDEGKAAGFLRTSFEDQPAVIDLFHQLPNVGMQSDLLRYLILHKQGGVYTDTDTIAIKPIRNWVPADMLNQVRLIVGVEFDRRDGGGWADIPHWLQLAQWTIAAAPGHPVFLSMVDRIHQSVKELSEKYKSSVDQLKPTSFEVMNSTGPAAWTDVVFSYLQQNDSSLQTTKDLSFMTGPKLYGDILVLNIDGFGMGQSHSHSTHDGSIPELALAKHSFKGSWRGD